MASNKTIYVCSQCGAKYLKWQGRCSQCGAWGTIQKKEIRISKRKKEFTAPAGEVVSLNKIKNKSSQRLETKIKEFDRVVGKGIALGSVILLGGEPGIGKSTLILQIAEKIASSQGKILYISGEESAEQVADRLKRLKLKSKNIEFSGETEIETILSTIKKEQPKLVIIDSIQTIYFEDLPSEPGTTNQIKVCTNKLIELAKKEDIAIIIIGHITKSGKVAGPKTLEHLVDVVLYLEGDKYHNFRILRSTKNRFGPTNEVGVFDMQANGLVEVKNPSEIFLAERKEKIPGSVVTAVLEGSRVFLIEIQSLLSWTNFGYPQRRSSGINLNRLQVLLAVLTKHAGLKLSRRDVHLNVVGGLYIKEPASDLAVCLAVASAYFNKPVEREMVVIGEVGLTGEIRPVSQIEKRIREAEKFGFKFALVPKSEIQDNYKIKIIQVENLNKVIDEFVR